MRPTLLAATAAAALSLIPAAAAQARPRSGRTLGARRRVEAQAAPFVENVRWAQEGVVFAVQGSTSEPQEYVRLRVDPAAPAPFSWQNVILG